MNRPTDRRLSAVPTPPATVTDITKRWPAYPVETRDERLERRAEVLHASVEDRHNAAHRGALDMCPDPICQALTDLYAETRR